MIPIDHTARPRKVLRASKNDQRYRQPLDNPGAGPGCHDFRDHDHDEDHEQDKAGLVPIEIREGGIERSP